MHEVKCSFIVITSNSTSGEGEEENDGSTAWKSVGGRVGIIIGFHCDWKSWQIPLPLLSLSSSVCSSTQLIGCIPISIQGCETHEIYLWNSHRDVIIYKQFASEAKFETTASDSVKGWTWIRMVFRLLAWGWSQRNFPNKLHVTTVSGQLALCLQVQRLPEILD